MLTILVLAALLHTPSSQAASVQFCTDAADTVLSEYKMGSFDHPALGIEKILAEDQHIPGTLFFANKSKTLKAFVSPKALSGGGSLNEGESSIQLTKVNSKNEIDEQATLVLDSQCKIVRGAVYSFQRSGTTPFTKQDCQQFIDTVELGKAALAAGGRKSGGVYTETDLCKAFSKNPSRTKIRGDDIKSRRLPLKR